VLTDSIYIVYQAHYWNPFWTPTIAVSQRDYITASQEFSGGGYCGLIIYYLINLFALR
jgi:hypothetical protein